MTTLILALTVRLFVTVKQAKRVIMLMVHVRTVYVTKAGKESIVVWVGGFDIFDSKCSYYMYIIRSTMQR